MSDKLFALILFLICIGGILAPREHTRKLRHLILLPINMKVWGKMSLLHAIIHAFLWQKGNGK